VWWLQLSLLLCTSTHPINPQPQRPTPTPQPQPQPNPPDWPSAWSPTRPATTKPSSACGCSATCRQTRCGAGGGEEGLCGHFRLVTGCVGCLCVVERFDCCPTNQHAERIPVLCNLKPHPTPPPNQNAPQHPRPPAAWRWRCRCRATCSACTAIWTAGVAWCSGCDRVMRWGC